MRQSMPRISIYWVAPAIVELWTKQEVTKETTKWRAMTDSRVDFSRIIVLNSLSFAAHLTHVELLDGAYSQLDPCTALSTSIRPRCHIHRKGHRRDHLCARLFTLHCSLVDSSEQSLTSVTNTKLF